MSLDTKAGANALKTVLTGLSGMGPVQLGVPKTSGPRVSAYVVAGSQTIVRKTTGTTARDARYNATLVYRVDGAETTAETTLMDLLDAFINALEADSTVGGVCKSIEIDTSLADAPEYYIRSGKEYREYPVLVTMRQYGTFNPNP